MNPLYKAFCRVFQTAFHLALPLLPYREPKIYNDIPSLAPLFAEKKIRSVLIVTDRGLRAHGATKPLEDLFGQNGIAYTVYEDTCANPTVDNVEEARRLYLENGCTALIAVGGGSPMDCAKAAGARIAYPHRSLSSLKGTLRVLRPIPTLIAIPTTAGTGSEVTVTAVITDPVHKHKYTMNSFSLIPRYAVLDPAVTVTLPPHLTATTGMDALTHAVEAYIGNSTSRETRALAEEATALIFANIETAVSNGTDLTARANMLRAAYAAGIAFSKSYVGYVHAVAHSLGGQYNIPHGLANAVRLPYVLDAYGSAVHKPLHRLAVAAGISQASDTDADAAAAFIAAIREMNRRMQIPETLPGIRREDIPQMAAHAAKEANPLYPVPVLMDAAALQQFYEQVMEK